MSLFFRSARNEELEKRLANEAKIAASQEVSEDILEEMLGEMVVEIAEQEMIIVERDKRLQKYFEVFISLKCELINISPDIYFLGYYLFLARRVNPPTFKA